GSRATRERSREITCSRSTGSDEEQDMDTLNTTDRPSPSKRSESAGKGRAVRGYPGPADEPSRDRTDPRSGVAVSGGPGRRRVPGASLQRAPTATTSLRTST